MNGTKMAKRATKKLETLELNPDMSAGSTWIVHRAGALKPLSVNADQLDVTESGALVFITGSADAKPCVVIPPHEYLYCTKSR
jgi:hypothetical protein